GCVSDAACRGSTHLFFAPDRGRPGRRARRETAARALCATCPVLLPCRDWARANREYGFWGGESEDERAAAGFRPVLASGLALRARTAERTRRRAAARPGRARLTPVRWVIIGAGAIGGLIGARLF